MQMIQGMFESLMMEIKGVKGDVSGLKQDVSSLKQTVDRLDEKVTRIDVTIENEIRPNIKLLAEGQETINRKLDGLADVPERLENLEIHVGAMSPAVHEHSIKLKQVK